MVGTSRFSPEEKAEIVLLALRSPDKVSEICREKGVAPVTYNKWKRKYLNGGMDAMGRSGDGNTRVEALTRNNQELENVVGRLYVELVMLKKKMGSGK